jgi:hypothetical protein
MIYLPNRRLDPCSPEQPMSWDSKEHGYDYWDITWVRLNRLDGAEAYDSYHFVDRHWAAKTKKEF